MVSNRRHLGHDTLPTARKRSAVENKGCAASMLVLRHGSARSARTGSAKHDTRVPFWYVK